MLLDGLRVVLVNTRFPENVGMAVRACANMGCPELTLVTPERWIPEKAAPLATPKGLPLLEKVRLMGSLEEATGDCHLIVATSARVGGWRRAIQRPDEAAAAIRDTLARGERAAIVFGSEDRGLENGHIEHCHHIVTIPTFGASSLNLAQSVLVMLYACAGAVRRAQAGQCACVPAAPAREDMAPGGITGADTERLMAALKDALTRLDVLHGDNPDYFLLPWRRLFARARLRRHEYDALMGLCRQVRAKVPLKERRDE